MQKVNQKVKAFTLVELIVVMAIIAILVGLSAAGISIVQRNARDQERIATLSRVNLEIESYRGVNGTYPDKVAGGIVYANGVITIGTKSVTLTGAATGDVGNATTMSTTDYCYTRGPNGATYHLAAQLESGGVQRFGSAPNCTVGTNAGF